MISVNGLVTSAMCICVSPVKGLSGKTVLQSPDSHAPSEAPVASGSDLPERPCKLTSGLLFIYSGSLYLSLRMRENIIIVLRSAFSSWHMVAAVKTNSGHLLLILAVLQVLF